MARDLFVDPLDNLAFDELNDFLGLQNPVESRPAEGTVLDYKISDGGDWPETVAAFANTSGGLLLLGVKSDKQKNNAPVEISGIAVGNGDLKTRLTAQIVSLVTPRPDFEVAVVSLPNLPNQMVVLVRVREGSYPPYQYARQDRVRFRVRVQDTTRDASLRDLEALFQKRAALTESTTLFDTISEPPLFPQFLTGYDTRPEPLSKEMPYHVWSIRPRVTMRIRLDRAFDTRARSSVSEYFPDSPYGQFWPAAMTGRSHVLRWQAAINNDSGPSARWPRNYEFNADGGLRLSEWVERRESSGKESISDLFLSGLRFLKLAESFYRGLNSFGSLRISHSLRVPAEFRFVFNFPTEDGVYRETNAIRLGQFQSSAETSIASMDTYDLNASERARIVTDIMLVHLRELRQDRC